MVVSQFEVSSRLSGVILSARFVPLAAKLLRGLVLFGRIAVMFQLVVGYVDWQFNVRLWGTATISGTSCET